MNHIEHETLLKRMKCLEDLDKTAYSELFRTKNIYLAAFLISRGLDWFGLEEVEVVNPYGRKSKLVYFLFKDRSSVEHTSLNFFNTNRSSLNVNANAFVQAILNVRSIVTNPPL